MDFDNGTATGVDDRDVSLGAFVRRGDLGGSYCMSTGAADASAAAAPFPFDINGFDVGGLAKVTADAVGLRTSA